MMKDKVMTPGCCETCVHEERDYYEFPCNECIRDTESDMYLPKPAEAPRIKDSGERRVFESGAVRDIQEGVKGRCDLIPLDVVAECYEFWGKTDKILWNFAKFQATRDLDFLHLALDSFKTIHFMSYETMLLEVSKHFEEGAKKYGEYNWQKGIPVHSYIDSAVRHYLKWRRGDKDEPHDRAFVWNILCCIWTLRHKPEMDDLPKAEDKTND